MSMVSERDAKADATSHAALKLVPLTQHIGCEVKGVNLRNPLEPAAASAIYRAWLDHAVLVFRDQDLTQEDLVRVTGIFGEFAPLGRPAHTLPSGFTKILPNIMLISNIRENGETIGALPDGEMMFHHDTIHRDDPHKATLLYSVEIPTHGGDTLVCQRHRRLRHARSRNEKKAGRPAGGELLRLQFSEARRQAGR
jgi:taurine dioxygenase